MVRIRDDERTTGDVSRRVIFGILVSMGMPAEIEAFLDDGLSDMDLPLSLTRHEGVTWVNTSAGSEAKLLNGLLAGRGERALPLVKTFIERQRQFAAPILARRPSGILHANQRFNRSTATVLPWMLSNPIAKTDLITQDGFSDDWKALGVKYEAREMFELEELWRDLFSVNCDSEIIGRLSGSPWTSAGEMSPTKHVSRLEGRRLTKLLSTNGQDGSLNRIYPWDDDDILRHMRHSNWQSLPTSSALRGLTEKQLFELLNYGRGHGGENLFGIHGEIKLETIPQFTPTDDCDILYEHRENTLELADLVLRVISRSLDAKSFGARAPQHRPEGDLLGEISQTSDLQVLHWLLDEAPTQARIGRDSLEERSPSTVTNIPDLHDAQNKRFLEYIFFTLWKAIRSARLSALECIEVLSGSRNSSPWIRDLRVAIRTFPLEVDPEARMNAAKLAQILKEMEHWGRSHPGYFLPGAADDERMILFSDSIENDGQGLAPSARRAQTRKQITGSEETIQAPENTAEAPTPTIQLDGMKLVACREVDRQPSRFDELRRFLENYLGEEIDWWPLRPLKSLPKEQHMQLLWEYGGEEMSIILNRSETGWFSINQTQAMGETHLMDTLPIAQPRSHQSNHAQALSRVKARKPFWESWIQYINKLLDNGRPDTPGSGAPTGSTQLETYLCVDKCWTTIKDTRMRTVAAIEDMQSDFDFFCRGRCLLDQAEGNWLQRKLSWRSYTNVTLARFHFLWDDTDEVEVEGKPPPRDTELFRGYQYTPIQDLSIDVQMRLCATILLRGIAKPELGRGRRQLLDSMPKLLAPPGLNKKQFSGGWGFHARQGLCMRKTMGWIGAVLVFGIAFVPYWLCAIDKLDLQTAFAPASFLATVLGVGLAMLAIAHTR